MDVIVIDNLTKHYGATRALDRASWTLPAGRLVGFLGPNGAGKTTLIKVLLGIVRKTSGEARMLGRMAGNRTARKQVGYLPENHRIPRHLTGNSALEYYGGLSGMSITEIRQKRPHLLHTVGLDEWGKTSVKKYSKGMLQRLGLAQAMLHDPDLLILDEPLSGLDPRARFYFKNLLLEEKQKGRTMLYSTHMLADAEEICDQFGILHQGEMKFIGTPAECLQSYAADSLEQAYMRCISTEG